MWKYAAAIIASTVTVWAAGAFINYDLGWVATVASEDRFDAVFVWVACAFGSSAIIAINSD